MQKSELMVLKDWPLKWIFVEAWSKVTFVHQHQLLLRSPLVSHSASSCFSWWPFHYVVCSFSPYAVSQPPSLFTLASDFCFLFSVNGCFSLQTVNRAQLRQTSAGDITTGRLYKRIYNLHHKILTFTYSEALWNTGVSPSMVTWWMEMMHYVVNCIVDGQYSDRFSCFFSSNPGNLPHFRAKQPPTQSFPNISGGWTAPQLESHAVPIQVPKVLSRDQR